MRGATPPATYELKLRESLFHGVRALRLTPIDSNVYGRDGLLAHTYMLGPRRRLQRLRVVQELRCVPSGLSERRRQTPRGRGEAELIIPSRCRPSCRYSRWMDGFSIRRGFASGAGLRCFTYGALLGALLATAPAVFAESTPSPTHGIAMHGAPALPPGFDHLPYADPGALKGGRLTIGVLGHFRQSQSVQREGRIDRAGVERQCLRDLMTRSLDEPFTLYGLIAQTIETDARSHFRRPSGSIRARISRTV